MGLGDRIELRGLRVRGRHGALPGEQDREQPFEVDVDVDLDLAVAGRSDELADALDYGLLVQAATAVVAGETWALLERMAVRIADEVAAADRRVRSVGVTVRKLEPPVDADLASAGVRVVRPGPAGRRRAFLGLGSNLGDRRSTLAKAVAIVAASGELVAVSPVYETEPVGGPDDQPPYLNLVVELSTRSRARGLLDLARSLEEGAGRERSAATERWGPRTLDVDVLWVEGEEVDEADLTVPHPRMLRRRFVLAPFADLAPDLLPARWEDGAEGEVRRAGLLAPR